MATDLTNITAQVKANTDVEASAVLLLNDLAARLIAAKTDPVAIQALADQLKSGADGLAAAIVANTPAV
jgi:hypothetical protein